MKMISILFYSIYANWMLSISKITRLRDCQSINLSSRCHDLGNTDLWDKIHLLFKAAIDNEDMSPEVRPMKYSSIEIF